MYEAGNLNRTFETQDLHRQLEAQQKMVAAAMCEQTKDPEITREMRRLDAEVERLQDALRKLGSVATVTKERDEATRLLLNYGRHINGCGNGWSCTCCFYDALAKLGADKTGEGS